MKVQSYCMFLQGLRLNFSTKSAQRTVGEVETLGRTLYFFIEMKK